MRGLTRMQAQGKAKAVVSTQSKAKTHQTVVVVEGGKAEVLEQKVKTHSRPMGAKAEMLGAVSAPAEIASQRTDILIADFPLRRFCRDVPLRIDRFDLWRSGAHAVFIDGGVLRVETARAAQGDRPWVVRPERRSTPFTARSPQDDRPLD